MKLAKLMQPISAMGIFPDLEITSVTCDSRRAEKGSVFVCIKGESQDGHSHAAEALKNGAAAIVCQRDCSLPNQIVVPDSRLAYSLLCARFFENPAQSMKLIGVTGTGGKTTTAWLINQMLEGLGKKTGLVGTICNQIYAGKGREPTTLPAKYTTPDPWELHALLRRMADRGCEYVVLEASSQALAQKRLEGCRFLCGVFTNLTPEHLDFHKTMSAYYQAKKKLLENSAHVVLNMDDPYGRRLAEEFIHKNPVTFSAEIAADYSAENVFPSPGGNRFTASSRAGEGRPASTGEADIPMPGRFSVSNAMAALAALGACGFKFEELLDSLNRCRGIPGRTEVLSQGVDFTIIRDYAHTPDSLEKVLAAIKEFSTGGLITLFGCPGRRDRGKRPAMAEVVARQSSLVVMTADNPREEPMQQIFDDARPGILKHSTPCSVIEDRREAIYWALSQCKKGDTLLLAGKGHEDYQVLADKTICFDEKQIVKDWIDKAR